MKIVIGLLALCAAVALATPPIFNRVLDYFLQARRRTGLPLERRGQTLALAAWVAGLLIVAILMLR